MPVHTAVLATALAFSVPGAQAMNPRATLLEARSLAYDANYKNDQEGLKSAIKVLQTLTDGHADASYAHYYLSWTYIALYASQFQAKDASGALDSATRAVEHARLGLAMRETDPEFHTLLTQSLVALMFADRARFDTVYAEALSANRRAVELGPSNPRVVLMDAGMIFNKPSDPNARERGLARFLEAIRLFDAEAQATTADPVAPRGGYASVYMTLATVYLRTNPPQKENARVAAQRALELRPDFWFVREVLLPRMQEK